MIVCICHNVNEKKIIQILEEKKLSNLSSLKKEIKICEQCKKCAPEIKEIIKIHLKNNHQ